MFDEKKFINIVSLRCVSCKSEFKMNLQSNDNLTDLKCPNCQNIGKIEVNFGKCK